MHACAAFEHLNLLILRLSEGTLCAYHYFQYVSARTSVLADLIRNFIHFNLCTLVFLPHSSVTHSGLRRDSYCDMYFIILANSRRPNYILLVIINENVAIFKTFVLRNTGNIDFGQNYKSDTLRAKNLSKQSLIVVH